MELLCPPSIPGWLTAFRRPQFDGSDLARLAFSQELELREAELLCVPKNGWKERSGELFRDADHQGALRGNIAKTDFQRIGELGDDIELRLQTSGADVYGCLVDVDLILRHHNAVGTRWLDNRRKVGELKRGVEPEVCAQRQCYENDIHCCVRLYHIAPMSENRTRMGEFLGWVAFFGAAFLAAPAQASGWDRFIEIQIREAALRGLVTDLIDSQGSRFCAETVPCLNDPGQTCVLERVRAVDAGTLSYGALTQMQLGPGLNVSAPEIQLLVSVQVDQITSC